jgi:hypothetical protein
LRGATSAVFNLVRRDFAPLVDRLRSVIARERQIDQSSQKIREGRRLQ